MSLDDNFQDLAAEGIRTARPGPTDSVSWMDVVYGGPDRLGWPSGTRFIPVCEDGGTVDAAALNPAADRHVGSTPTPRIADARPGPEEQERKFPVILNRGVAAHPLTIPWSVAEKAYSVYAAKYGTSKSLERLAQRGGFHAEELNEFHPTWREEAGEIAQLKAELAALRAAARVPPPPAPRESRDQPMTTVGEVHCRHCGVDIRLIDGRWLDRETHATCELSDEAEAGSAVAHVPLEQGEDSEIVSAVAAIVRDADAVFQKSGGSSRHWTRDCFLPLLNARNLKIVAARVPQEPPEQ